METIGLRISEEIKKAQLVLHLVSNRANISTATRKEITWAIIDELTSHKIKVMPVLLDGETMPHYLRDKHFADLTKDFEEGIDKIIFDIQKILGFVPMDQTPGVSRLEKDKVHPDSMTFEKIVLLILAIVFILWAFAVFFYPFLFPQVQKVPAILITQAGAISAQMFKSKLMNLQMERDANFAEDMGILHLTHFFQRHYRVMLIRHSHKTMVKSIILIEVIGSMLTALTIIGFFLFIKDIIML